MNPKDTLEHAAKLRASGHLDQAVDVYRQFLDRFPADVDARRNFAGVLAEVGKADSAISNYVKVQEMLAAEGDLLGAIAAGLKVTEIDPRNDNPLSHLAKTQTEHLQTQRLRRAETEPFTPQEPFLDIPLLYELNPAELKAVARRMRMHEKQPGEAIFEEGDEGDSVFFVHRGLVEVSSGRQRLGRLGRGECLGEFSFLTRKPRTASVRALESTELLELSATDMDTVVRAHPRLHKLLHQMYRERALVNVLARSPLFEMLSAEDRDRVAAQVDLVTIKRGESVVRRGEGGGAIYLVKSGKLEVRAEASEDEEIKLATLSPHQFFGEVSFLTGVPRTATVIALEESELLKLNAEELRRLVEDYPVMTRVLKRYHLDRVMATAETLKAFLKRGRVEGVLR